MKVTVGTAVTELDLSSYSDVGNAGQRKLVLQNLGPGTVYFDTLSDVTTASGVELSVNGSFDLDYVQPVYVIASAASTDLRVTVVG